MKNIYTTINEVMAEIGAIGKNSKNSTQGFMFRGIDAVMNALNPALLKHRLFIVPEILEQTREERTNSKGTTLIYSICKVKYTFYAEDGSSISAVVIGEGMDTGDKATNKAMSIAFKYACFQVFCIPTEEMVDPDQECHEVTPKAKAQRKATPKQIEILKGAYTGENMEKLLKANEIEKIDDLPIDVASSIIKKLTEITANINKSHQTGGKEHGTDHSERRHGSVAAGDLEEDRRLRKTDQGDQAGRG